MGLSGNIISSDYRGPLVDILVWICLVISCLAVASKILVKLVRWKNHNVWSRLQFDDVAIVFALAFSAVFSVCTSRQVAAGLGSPIERLSPVKIATLEKMRYASEFMYASSLSSANLCGILFGLFLEPAISHQRLLRYLFLSTLFWHLSSVVTVAVQCSLPNRWQMIYNECIDTELFWTFFDVTNILINMFLCCILCHIVWILQMSHKRILLVLLFSMRLLIIIPMAFKVYYLYENGSSGDPTLDGSKATIASIFVLHTTITATCIPFMKSIVERLQPGWSTGSIQPAMRTLTASTNSDFVTARSIKDLRALNFSVQEK